jgi:long-chain acyl-CoA synthetase
MKNYPLYIVAQIDNLYELLDYAAERYADNSAFSFMREDKMTSVTYRALKQQVHALGSYLLYQNVQKIKVALVGENSYEWILTYLAVVNSGNVIVPLDNELTAEEIENLAKDSGSNIFIYSNQYVHIANYLKERKMGIKHYINMNDFPKLIKKGYDLIQQGEKSIAGCKIDNAAIAALLYTSGTTGAPKGVMLSHLSLAHNAVAASQYVAITGSNMMVLPLHHSFGFLTGVCVSLLQGSEICICSGLKNVMSDMEKYKPHCMFLVPLFVETFYKKIWSNAKKQGKDALLKRLIAISHAMLAVKIDARRFLFKSVLDAFGGNLKLIVSGGAPLETKYIRGLRDFGIHVLNGYGITECSPIVSVNRNQYYCDGSIGLVLPCCTVKILEPDENGQGEICVKGDNIMLGYYKSTHPSNEVFDGDWFKTGDIGYMDENEFLFITGRKKNLIILNNGKNVYPEEVEFEILRNIPYVKETIVYAENHGIVAEVLLDIENEPDCASRLNKDIVELNRKLPMYKNIGKAVIRDVEFDKTSTKKIKRS